jgi:tellurite resistance protein TerA
MADREKTSVDSIAEATRNRAKFSGHGDALGAAGKRVASTVEGSSNHLREPGSCIAINPKEEGGFKSITIGVEWDNVKLEDANAVEKVLKKTLKIGVDLDLGCLYELADGSRGAVQAFGDKYGSADKPPYIKLSGDETTGNSEGLDEVITIKGVHWGKISRILVYLYIYEGAPNWAEINPRVTIDVPGNEDLLVSLSNHNDKHVVCAVGGLENVNGGIKLTNYTEYFPGHDEMDRAFGFGLEWGEAKQEE